MVKIAVEREQTDRQTDRQTQTNAAMTNPLVEFRLVTNEGHYITSLTDVMIEAGVHFALLQSGRETMENSS